MITPFCTGEGAYDDGLKRLWNGKVYETTTFYNEFNHLEGFSKHLYNAVMRQQRIFEHRLFYKATNLEYYNPYLLMH